MDRIREPLFYESQRRKRYSGDHVFNTGASYHTIPLPQRVNKSSSSKNIKTSYRAHSELPSMPREHQLGWLSTSALIFNKMIGTGIYNSPMVVLAAIRSKWMSLVIWLVGCLMTWGGLTIYLEYGMKWPKTGGELYYVDRIFSRPNQGESPRRKNLRRIFTYIFASMFVLVNGVQANALQFGLQVILASSYGRDKSNNEQLDKFLAIVIITFVCQLHSYSRSIYINIANVLAIIKASSLAFISICGFLALGGFRISSGQERSSTKYGMQNLKLDFDSKSNNPFEYALALLSVIRAFQGYENANFVLEEVRTGPAGDETQVFRRTMITAVISTCCLNFLVNIAIYLVLTTEEIINTPLTLALFFGKVFGDAERSAILSAVILAFSAAGALVGLTFANARVKQEIGRIGILPIPEYWAATSRRRTPSHALFLHWIFSVVCILITPLSDPAGFLVMSTLYMYLHAYVGVFLGCALLCARWLPSFQDESSGNVPWKPQSSSLGWWLLVPLTVIYILGNIFVLVLSWFPASFQVDLGTSQSTLSNYTGPIAGICVIGIGILWWAWDTYIAEFFGYRFWTDEDPKHESVVFGSQVTLITYNRELREGSVADHLYTFSQATYDKVEKLQNFLSRASKDVASPEADHILEKSNSLQSQTHIHNE